MCVCSVAQSCLTLCDPMDYSLPGSSVHGNSPGKDTGVHCHFLLQRIFPTQGSNPHLLHLLPWQVDSLSLWCLRSPPSPQACVWLTLSSAFPPHVPSCAQAHIPACSEDRYFHLVICLGPCYSSHIP